jgi:predicted metal-dependent phosphoesterase TrpH
MSNYKFDTHVHTSETSPCGRVDAKTLVRLYKKAGYSGVVITDHYYSGFFEALGEKNWEEKIDLYLRGFNTAAEEGRKEGLKVILGLELRFEENFNDYLVYGIDKEFLLKYRELYKLNLIEFREFIKGKDIVIYQAHPYRTGLRTADPSLIDGVEVYNGNKRHNSSNDKALLYAQGNNLKMLSGSDFHQLEDFARGGIILSENPCDSHEFAKLLKEDKATELITTK